MDADNSSADAVRLISSFLASFLPDLQFDILFKIIDLQFDILFKIHEFEF